MKPTGTVLLLCTAALLSPAMLCPAYEFAPEGAPEGWKVYSQRPDLAPKAWVEKTLRLGGRGALALSGGGHPWVNGCWTRTVEVKGGRTYHFSARYLSRNVELQRRSVLARIVWIGFKGPRKLRYEYPPTVLPSGKARSGEAAWGRIEGWCKAPDGAKQARLELVYRWDGDGEVFWDAVRFEPAPTPSRKVRIATIFCRPRNTGGPSASVEKFARLVLEAAARKPDIICLPEGITVVGTGKNYVDVAEPVPGPTTRRLGELARKVNAYIVAGIYERQGPVVYNTAVLVGRDGRLVGRYRKVSLPDEEIDGGITPGDSFPVFQTDFGKVGMMICWDVFFPEPARALASKGAEIVFLPIWGGNQKLIEARAVENQVYLVTSSYDAKTAVYDRRGEALAVADAEHPIAVVEVDLAQTTRWEWLGDYRGRIPREAPPVRGEFR